MGRLLGANVMVPMAGVCGANVPKVRVLHPRVRISMSRETFPRLGCRCVGLPIIGLGILWVHDLELQLGVL